jgi:ABC-2 type transport system ATP-binding protein
MYDITQKFTVSPANFKSLYKELKLEIQLGNAMPNELLQVLTQRGQDSFCRENSKCNDILFKQ